MALKNRLQVLKNVVGFDEKLQFSSNGRKVKQYTIMMIRV